MHRTGREAMATMRIERPKVGWRVWLGWMLASIASGAVTLTVTGAMVRAGSPNATGVVAVFGLVIGASLGITQWLVVRRQVPRAYMWVLASVMGGIVIGFLGFAMGGPRGGPLGGSVIGASLGITQWLVLRHRVRRPMYGCWQVSWAFLQARRWALPWVGPPAGPEAEPHWGSWSGLSQGARSSGYCGSLFQKDRIGLW